MQKKFMPVSLSLPADRTLRLDYIDGLRAIAILAVVGGHYYQNVYAVGLPRWVDFMGWSGGLGVQLFLMLSGFCVSWQYLGPKKRAFTTVDFIKRRANRILPAYYAALLISLFFYHPPTTSDLVFQIATHATLTHNLFPSSVLEINGPLWSIALEFQLYLAFPMLFRIYRTNGLTTMLVVCFVIEAVFRCVVAYWIGTDFHPATFSLAYSVPGRIFEFALGIAAAAIIAGNEPRATRFTRLHWLSFALLIFLLPLLAVIAKRFTGVTSPLTEFLLSIFFFLLLTNLDKHETVGNWLFSRPALTWVGKVSYSVYLMHILILPELAGAVVYLGQPWIAVSACVPVVLLVVLICSLFYYAVEAPSLAYFRRGG